MRTLSLAFASAIPEADGLQERAIIPVRPEANDARAAVRTFRNRYGYRMPAEHGPSSASDNPRWRNRGKVRDAAEAAP